MEKFLELIAILILTIIGFVVPIISLLLSIFNEGVQKLSVQYSIEKEKSEENIKNQLKKIEKLDNTNISDIQTNLEQLEKINKDAQTKLSFLNPKNQIIRLSIPLFISFLLIASFFIVHSLDFKISWLSNDIIYLLLPIIGFCLFGYSIRILWKLLGIITEVIGLINLSRKETETTVIELLSNLVEKTKSQLDFFLKKVYLKINSVKIKDDKFSLDLNSDEKCKLKISLENNEKRMAKEVEVGFIFPTEFLIEKSASFTIYNDTENQVIRYKVSTIQGDTHQLFSDLSLTPLKKGTFKIKTFIKAENIESIYYEIALNIK